MKGGIAAAGDVGLYTPFGPGAGGRAGLSVYGVYLGVDAMYYQGTGDGLSTILGGFEAGYGFKLAGDRFTLRPQFGLGSLGITGGDYLSTYGSGGFSGGVIQTSRVATGVGFLYLEPGITALVGFPTWFFVGADLNVLVIPQALHNVQGPPSTLAALAAHAQVGVKF